MRQVRLTRDELYGKVWSEPMRTLAQQYDLSDVGLAKICKRLKIPVPGRGYWAKKAAGQLLRQPPLPVVSPDALLTAREAMLGNRPIPIAPPLLPRRLIQTQSAFEEAPENRIVVSDTLRGAHSLVRKTAQALRGTAKSPVQFPFNSREPHLDVQVSRDLLTRALRVTDALLKAFTKRGWKVSLGSKERGSRQDHKSYVTVLGRQVPFGIRERMKKVANPPGKPVKLITGGMYTPLQSKYRDAPSGRLSLVLRSRWGNSVDTSLDDTPNHRVEERLNEFLVAVVTRAYEDLEWDAGAEDNQRNWAAEARRQAEESGRRDEQQQRVFALEEEAANWSKSHLLASYLSALRTAAQEQAGANRMDQAFEEWLSWAEAYAASLNPMRAQLRQLTGLIK